MVLPHGKLLSGPLLTGDERTFLKALAEKQLHMEISVRPPFLTWVVDGVRYSAHRCQILTGTVAKDWTSIPAELATDPQTVSALL